MGWLRMVPAPYVKPVWRACGYCDVVQPEVRIDGRGQCEDREACARWCRDSRREWVTRSPEGGPEVVSGMYVQCVTRGWAT